MARGARTIEADRIPTAPVVMNRFLRCSATSPHHQVLLSLILLLLWSSSAWAQGWYLLQPPEAQKSSGPAEPDASRPLSEWRQFMAFGSADECEHVRVEGSKGPARELAEAKREVERITKDESVSLLERASTFGRWQRARKELLRWEDSRCINSNDPRLR